MPDDGGRRRRHRCDHRCTGEKRRARQHVHRVPQRQRFFFGEHALGPERRFAYEESIRSPFVVRIRARSRPAHAGANSSSARTSRRHCWSWREVSQARRYRDDRCCRCLQLDARWRKSILIEYWAEQALPWLVGMTYKAVRTDRYKYIHWVNRGRTGELDELYDLDRDPFELDNLNRIANSHLRATSCVVS